MQKLIFLPAYLSDLSISFQTKCCVCITADRSTIQTLSDHLEVYEVITALLDEDDSFWFKFGQKFGIKKETLKYLRPDPIKSPTKAVIKAIVSNDPGLQMMKFIDSLENLNQKKLIGKLKTLFHFSWI